MPTKPTKKATKAKVKRTHRLVPSRPVTPGSKLTKQQARFVHEYLIDLNGTRAAIRAGYAAKAAPQQAYDLLSRPHIQAAVNEAMQARSDRVRISQDDVLRELIGIATADVNELVEHRQGACRFCHGKDHRYQRTPNEMRNAQAQWERDNAKLIDEGQEGLGEFDDEGGSDYNATLPPHASCPECFGEGVSRELFKDTTLASRGAKSLYAGFKRSKDGVEIKVHSQVEALGLLGRHLAMFTDNHKHKGDPENPISILLAQMGNKSSLPVVATPTDDSE